MATDNKNRQNNRSHNGSRRPSRKMPQSPFPRRNIGMWIYGIFIVIIIVWGMMGNRETPVKTNWYEVEQMIAAGDVERIEIVNKEQAEVYLKREAVSKYRSQLDYKHMPEEGVQLVFNIGSVDSFRNDLDKAQSKYDENIPVSYENRRNVWSDLLIGFVPYILLIAFLIFMMRSVARGAGGGAGGQGVFNVGKAKAQIYDKNGANRVTFKDVAGLEEAKVEIMEIVDFLRKPEKYKELGGKIPKGALLVGPPGTGKTLLAKAVAGEANVPFFSMSGSDFVEMFVGVGASRVRDLFHQAKEKAPCIVFIDEIDAIGRARGKNAGFSGNDERENTLNQLLTEMDGFGTNSGVIVLAATNRVDILDKALMRAGRFDRQIEVGLPDVKEREEIFGVHLRPLKLAADIDREFLARQTAGFSGADIANVCNEAALIAARNDKKAVGKVDFLAAIDRIVGGLEKKHNLMTTEDKRKTAYHEVGHAMVSWLVESSDPVVKVTIIPRGRSLGATWYLPEDKVMTSREEFVQQMASLVAGRVSEELVFGTVATGALNDLERATKIAYAMVAYYGMSDRVGHLSYYDSTGQQDMAFTKPFSEQTAEAIDQEVKRFVDEAYGMAEKILSSHRTELDTLAHMLLERETIFAEDVEQVLGKSAKERKLAQSRQGNGNSGESHKNPVDEHKEEKLGENSDEKAEGENEGTRQADNLSTDGEPVRKTAARSTKRSEPDTAIKDKTSDE